MKDREAILRQALEKYRLTEPVPPELRQHIRVHRRSALNASLRSLGRYNPFTGMVTACYFASRRMGFGLTMAQSLAVCLAAVILSAGALSAGIYGVIRLAIPGEPAVQRTDQPETKENRIIPAGEADEIQRISFEPLTDLIVFNKMIVIDVPGSEADRIFSLLRNSVLKEMEHLSGAVEPRRGKTLRTRLLYSGDMYSLYITLVGAGGIIVFSRSYNEPSIEALSARIPEAARHVAVKIPH
jgi:hypothetical protein